MSDPETPPEAPPETPPEPAPPAPEQQVAVEEQTYEPGPNDFGRLSDDGLEVVRFVSNVEESE